MKRHLLALPFAGAMMMTASLVYAQTPPPATPSPADQEQPAAPADEAASSAGEQDEVQPERGDCMEPAGQSADEGSAADMAALETEDADGETQSASADVDNDAASAEADEPANSAGAEASAEQSESETQPVAGPDAGTAPGGSGSSGWTGGLGGSDIGTSQSEELDSSPQQEHPQVASGLDPISGETAVEGPQAPAELDEDAAVVPTAPSEDAADC